MRVKVTMECLDSDVDIMPEVFEAEMASIQERVGIVLDRDETTGEVIKIRKNGQKTYCIRMWTGCKSFEDFTTEGNITDLIN